MRRRILRLLFAFAFWLAAGQAARATGLESVGHTALIPALSQGEKGHGFVLLQSPLEERLFAEAAEGRLDAFAPLEAALVASGVEDAETLRHYQQKAAALVERLHRATVPSRNPVRWAEAIFEFMHRHVLVGGYELAHTDLRRVFDDGRFNCVTATVLFNYLAGECGLKCRGLEMPGHAMSRLLLPSGALDIETTCPRWFQMVGDSDSRQAAAPQRISSAVAADPAKAREVSPLQMAAMIYYNRGVDLLAEKRFAEAAEVNAKALRLDPLNAVARANLLATINNWSIELGNTRQFSKAVDLLREGLRLDARFEPFAQNYVHVHRQWVERLCRAGHFEEALDVLSRAAAEMPDRDYLRRARSEVQQQWAEAVLGVEAVRQ